MKIYLNAGHDKRLDSGAVNSVTGLREADVVAEICRHMYNILSNRNHIVKVIQNDSLGYICDKANEFGADIFISVHCNGFTDSRANGTETLCHPSSVEGRVLSSYLQDAMIKEFGLYNRGVKSRDNLYVLNATNMPAALVETAFITNMDEEKLLANEAHRWATALCQGIANYENK